MLLMISCTCSLLACAQWFHKRHKKAMGEALEKMKAELMLVGFISLLLTVAQTPISKICISKEAGMRMLPCKLNDGAGGGGPEHPFVEVVAVCGRWWRPGAPLPPLDGSDGGAATRDPNHGVGGRRK